jgi:hypothetical protein
MAFTLQYFEGSPVVASPHSPPAEPPHPRSEAFATRADALERARVLLTTPGVHALLLCRDGAPVADQHQLARELGVRLPPNA